MVDRSAEAQVMWSPSILPTVKASGPLTKTLGGLEVGGFLKEAFEADYVAVDAGLNEGKLRQQLALLLLSKSGVQPKTDWRAVIDHRRERV
jgi:hypothetical protein